MIQDQFCNMISNDLAIREKALLEFYFEGEQEPRYILAITVLESLCME